MSPHRAIARGVDKLAAEVGSKTVAWILTFVVTISVGLVIAAVGGYITVSNQADQISNQADSNSQTAHNLTLSVCALRAEEHRRIDSTEAYLKTHPQGVPGIATAKQLRASEQTYRTTLRALRFVSCVGVVDGG